MHEALRRKKAMAAVSEVGAEALLVTHPADVRYLTGFTGSNGAVAVAGRRAVLFTDGRYNTQAKAEVEGVRVVIGPKAAALLALEWLVANKVTRCCFDPSQMAVATFEKLRKALPGDLRRKFLVPAAGLVAKLRELKDAD
jgi:Xaa-Pro aminopeptidase